MVEKVLEKVAEGRAVLAAGKVGAVKEAFALAKAAEALLGEGIARRAFKTDEDLETARGPLVALWVEAYAAKDARRRK